MNRTILITIAFLTIFFTSCKKQNLIQDEIGELSSENVKKFLKDNEKAKKFNYSDYGDGVWLQISNIPETEKTNESISDIKWLKKYIPLISNYITVVELWGGRN